jgi:hypothetical protein
METLIRIIKNETEALNILPVVNQNVTRWSFIKEIEPNILIDYALNKDLGKPEINTMTNRLEISVKVANGTILLASKELKIKSTYEL